MRVWIRNADYWDAYFDLLENIKEALDANAIDIPYPQMDIRVQQVVGALNAASVERMAS
ncbi:Small-conductance mechanosensitive channel [compost metagenome]